MRYERSKEAICNPSCQARAVQVFLDTEGVGYNELLFERGFQVQVVPGLLQGSKPTCKAADLPARQQTYLQGRGSTCKAADLPARQQIYLPLKED